MPSPLRRVVLAVLCAAALPAMEEFCSIDGLDELGGDGVATATRGMVVRLGERTLIADGGRIDYRNRTLFLTGGVLFRQPALRLTAERLGLRLAPGHSFESLRSDGDLLGWEGDAWKVEARFTTRGRTVRINAEHVALADGRLVFSGVDLDFGYGSVISFSAPTVIVTLRRPQGDEPPSALRSHLDGVQLVSPTGELVGLPVLWLPYLYRDFSRRYPWTRVRGGYTRRQGTYGRFWIGSDLPLLGGWKTGLDGRIDDHSRSGAGFGLRPYWQNGTWGHGDLEWYVMPKEAVRGGDGDRDELQTRRAEAVDAQHQIDLGRGAFYGRFTSIPGGDVPGTPPDYRFLQDYLPERLEHDPLPRRGATLAYGLPGITATIDGERRIQADRPDTERWFGLQAQVHPLQIAGPLHAAADGWVEDLHRVTTGTAATRLTSRGWLGAGWWLPGGVGLDADGGIRELRYADGEIAGVDQADGARRAGFADAGVKLRLSDTFGANGLLTHTLTPRLGVQLLGPGAGDELPAYGFDARDTFEEDARYWVAGLDTAVVSTRTLFHASLLSRWAMREQERLYTDDNGDEQLSPQRLVDVVGTVDGSPVDPLHITASFTYDARPRRWTGFDTDARWRVAPWGALSERSTLIQDTREWSHTPGTTLYANRYRADASATFRPGGAGVDGWLIELTRRMVEGDLFLGFEFLRDEEGRVSDHRVSIGFTLGGGTFEDDDRRAQARTSLSR